MHESPIIGHASELARLERDRTAGNVSHAYLFAGPKGVGKFTMAKHFGLQLLADAAPAEKRDDIVRRATHLIHPDFLVLDKLWIEEKMEDWDELAKYSNVPQVHRSKSPKVMRTDMISIDDVRAIQDRLQETGEGAVRACLIRSVERMRDEAANALLKMLEEPPPGRVFLFTTQALSRLLPTILSRVRLITFHPVAPKLIDAALQELKIDEEDRRFLVHASQGSPGKALALARDPELLRAEKTLFASALAFWESPSPSDRLAALTPLHERGEEAERLLFHLALALRQHSPRDPARLSAYLRLIANLSTNAHRQLIVQRFALSL